MREEASLEIRLRKIDETRNCLSDEIKHIDCMSKKYKKTCKYLNYAENLLIRSSTVAGCVKICFIICNLHCFISLCSCRNYDFCSSNKHLCNHCRN